MLKKLFNRKKFVTATADPLAAITLHELIKLRLRAKQLPLQSQAVTSTLLTGDKRARFKGRGMDFDSTREYERGDDIRRMDWRVTARTGKAHTKVYREERERPVYCVVDNSSSMWFGTQKTFKAVRAIQAAAMIAWASVEQGDRVGGVVCDADKLHVCKPVRGQRGALRLLHLLAQQRPDTAASKQLFNDALLQMTQAARPGSLVFVLTDAMNFDADTELYLAQLSKHCDVTLVFTYDPLEAQLPTADGNYTFTDGTATLTYAAHDNTVRSDYHALFAAREAQTQKLCQRYRLRYLTLCTTDDITDLSSVLNRSNRSASEIKAAS